MLKKVIRPDGKVVVPLVMDNASLWEALALIFEATNGSTQDRGGSQAEGFAGLSKRICLQGALGTSEVQGSRSSRSGFFPMS